VCLSSLDLPHDASLTSAQMGLFLNENMDNKKTIKMESSLLGIVRPNDSLKEGNPL